MIGSTPARDPTLDSFRGLTVLLMIVVNMQGNADAAYGWVKHAEWHGATVADFVFPVFMLIVGLSLPLALERPGRSIGWAKMVRRAVLLFMIGVGLSWLIRPTLDPDMVRWTGVLQRIAVAYLACAVVMRLRQGIGPAVALSISLLVLHSVLILRVGAPGEGAPSLEPGMGISGWLDQAMIPGRVLRGTWDPEGVLSTLPAIVTTLIGVAVMRRMLGRGMTNGLLLATGAVLVAAGIVLSPWLPINKNLWTASFTFVTAGAGLVAWVALRAAWPMIGHLAPARWSVTLGQAALTLYVVHTLILAILVRRLPGGERIWDALWGILSGTGLHPGLASLLYAAFGAAISCALLAPLRRRGWVLKL